MKSPRFPGIFIIYVIETTGDFLINNLIIAHDKTFFEMDIHLVNGCPCLTVTITIGVDHTDLACTMKFPAKKKRNIDPALGKRNMILHQNMDRLLTGLLIRCSA